MPDKKNSGIIVYSY